MRAIVAELSPVESWIKEYGISSRKSLMASGVSVLISAAMSLLLFVVFQLIISYKVKRIGLILSEKDGAGGGGWWVECIKFKYFS